MSGAIGFARIADGFRGWFAAVTDNGELRSGLVAGDFVATVINPGDTANTIAAISESTQKPGVYKFDIPSAFFTAHGAGEYAVLVQIDTVAGPSDPPNVIDIVTAILTVSQQDFDSLATQITAATQDNRVVASFAFDVATTTLDGNVWLERDGQIITAVTSATAEFYGSDGTLLFAALSDLTPDAQGVFRVTKSSPGFTAGDQVYVRLQIVSPSGTFTSLKGIQVVG